MRRREDLMAPETEKRTDGGDPDEPGVRFEELARRSGSQSGGSAFAQMLTYVFMGRRWWVLPVVLALLLMGILIALGTSAAAPFIYTLF
jgi:hypothetical protein